MTANGNGYIGGQPPNPRPRRKLHTAPSRLRIQDVISSFLGMKSTSIYVISNGTKKKIPHCDREATGEGCFLYRGLTAPNF